MANFEALLEAERRGILPPDKQGQLNEARSRGLIEGGPPPFTAEQQQALEALPPRPSRPIGVSSGMVPVTAPTIGFDDGITFDVAAPETGPRPPSIGERAQAVGIGERGAPAGARFDVGFAQDPIQGAKLALEKKFGQGVQVFQRPELDGQLTFIDPQTGQEQLFDPSGFELGEIPGVAGPATVIAPEVIGGVGGALFGGPAGGIAGAGGGAGIGEAARLQVGRALGVNPELTAMEQLTSAGREAAVAAAFEAGTLGAGALARRAVRGGLPAPPGGVLEDVPQAALEEGLTRGRGLQEEFQDVFGLDLPLNTEQVLRDTAATQARELRGATETARGRTGGEQLREQRRAQAGVMEEAAERVLGPESVPPSPGGRALQAEARRGPQEAIARERATLEGIDKQLERDEQLTAVSQIDAGAAVRDLLETGREKVFGEGGSFDVRYTQLDEATGGVKVDLTPVNVVGKDALEVTDADLFQSLAPENRTILLDAIRGGTRKRAGLEFGPDRVLREVEGIEQVGVPLEVVMRGLSDLRAERRAIRKGQSTRRNIGQVNSLIESLERARTNALGDNPALVKQVLDLEADFASAKQRIDRGLVGQILRTAEGGGFKLADDKVIQKLLSNKDLAVRMADVLSDPAFQFAPGARIAVREGFLARIQRAAVDPDTGRMNRRALNRFMVEHKETLEAYFDPATVAKLSKVSTTMGQVDILTKRMDRITTDINKSFGMQLQKYDPSQVVGRVWKGAKTVPEDLRRARVIAARDPVALEEYQKALRAAIRRSSTKSTSVEPGKLDYSTLANIAQNKEVVDELGKTMGTKWRLGFDVLTKALDTTRMAPTDAAAIQAMQAAGEPGSVIQGMLRVAFPPLTREGRALTGILRTNRESVIRTLDNVLANPDEMAKFSRLRNVRNKRNALRALEAIGLGHIAREMDAL